MARFARYGRVALLAMTSGLAGCFLRAVLPIAPMEDVPDKIAQPVRRDARLAVLWVGHATVLIQMDDKLILTDPVFTATVGQLSKRMIEPGLDRANVPPVDAVLISHMHFDHLSLRSLEMLEKRIKRLYVPEGGLVYVP